MSIDEREVTLGGLLHPRAASRTLVHAAHRPRLTWHQESVTCLISTWLLCGLYMDGWAHANQSTLDSITTPWHGIFYGSFAVLAGWIVWHLRFHHDNGHRSLAAIPEGYAGALIGIAIFMVSAIGDQIWHEVWGIERDLKAFLSPTHLGLVIGMILIISAPMRSAWSDPEISRRPSFMRVLPGFWSLTLVAMLILLMYQYIATFPSDLAAISHDGFVNNFPGTAPEALLGVYINRFDIQGIAMLHVTNYIVLVPLLLGLRRWRFPFGCTTIYFTALGASVAIPYQYNKAWTVLGVAVAGLLCDLLLQKLRPSPAHVWAFRGFALLSPIVLWVSYFVTLEIAYGIGWDLELWTGTVVLASLTTLGIAYAMVPTPFPHAPDAGAAALHRNGPRRKRPLRAG